MKFELLEQKILNNIPSASGLVKHRDSYYVLGDDSPYLFKLNSNCEVVGRIPIVAHEQRERIPKREKHDFEALEMISENEIVGFGSGSLSPQRDSMIKITIGNEATFQTFSLTSFYSDLKVLEVLQGSELNIEAAAFHEDQLHLFNRRKNVIFSLSFPDFLSAIENGSAFPPVLTSAFELPEIYGIEAGFSGAAVTASGKLVVTCSVENTPNAYDDGEVLGSFVGISSGVKNGIFETFSWTRINSEEPLKVESITVEREILNTEIALVLVTDSDGADSLVIKGTLSL